MCKLLLTILLCSLVVFAASPPATTLVWRVFPSTGNDQNGGAFDPGVASPGTDFSTQGSPQITFTDLVIGATTTQFTSMLNPVGATFPGNVINIVGGIGCTTGRFDILSNATITATVDLSMGTAASVCNAYLGGALKTLPTLNTAMAGAAQHACIKAEATIVMGRIDWAAGQSPGGGVIEGYTTTCGDNGQVTLQENANDYFFVISGGSYNMTYKNFILDKNGQVSGSTFLTNGGCCITAENIKAIGATNPVIPFEFNAGRSFCINSYATGNSGTGRIIWDQAGDGTFDGCGAYSNTNTSVVFDFSNSGGNGTRMVRGYAANNTGATSTITANINAAPVYISNFTSVNNGGDGVLLSTATTEFAAVIRNSVFALQGGCGIKSGTAVINAGSEPMNYNGFYSNTGGNYCSVSAGPNDQVLSVNPFTNSAGNDLTLNSTAGGGAQLKGAGSPGVTPVGTGHIDIGFLQSAGGSSSMTVGYPVQ